MGNLSWFNKTYSMEWLRSKAKAYTKANDYIFSWLRDIGVVPKFVFTYREFSAYPLLDKDAIKGEHLASLAVEWDKQGPSQIDEWLDMVEFECAGTTKRDIVREALERVV